jgi:hypothetical protein
MPIEKQGSSSERDILGLIKMADAKEHIIVYDLDDAMDKPAVAVVATGPRAAIVRRVFEELSGA